MFGIEAMVWMLGFFAPGAALIGVMFYKPRKG